MLFTAFSYAKERVITDSEGMKCHVYLPAEIDPGKTYQLLVGVHFNRGNGKGAAGLRKWAERGDVIVIGPSFRRGYQMGRGDHAQKLIKLFKQLSAEYKLKDKMFIHGHSGGSQFAHRFAMNHPRYVCGVSAHSGGSWATDGYGQISSKAKKIPFAISCGEKDTKRSSPKSKYTRLVWYKRFRDEIDQKKFCYVGGIWPNVGHGLSPQAWALMRQCFQIATGLPGGSRGERVKITDAWKNLDQIDRQDIVAIPSASVPYVDPVRLSKITKAAFRKAQQEDIPDFKLVSFMIKYPPVLWKDQPGSKALIAQCVRAAGKWRNKEIKAGRFTGKIRRKFERFSQGLIVPK